MPTTLPGSTTTTTVPVGDGPVLGPVPTVSGLLDARPAADIPWESTAGGGWLLFGFRPESPEPWRGPHVLYLMDGSDVVYEVGAWRGSWPLVEDWSAVGRSVLVVDEDGLWLVDLVSGAPTHLIDAPLTSEGTPIRELAARFVAPDDGLIAVRTTTYEDGLPVRARLDLISHTGVWMTTLSDTGLETTLYLDPAEVPRGVSWVALPDGSGIVLSDAGGIRLVDRSGATVRVYDAPGLGCGVVRGWGEAVLLSCVHPDYVASGCFSLWGRDGYAALWAMPIGGSPAEEIYVPLPPPDGEDCWTGAYIDAVPLSESSPKVLLELSGGCCGCGGSLELRDGARPPLRIGPTEEQTCWPDLLYARGSGWLVADDHGALFVIEPDGSYTDLVPRAGVGAGVTGVWRADDYSLFGMEHDGD